MVFRRFAFAIGLLLAALASQLPEFTQQYRQRLGGAIDELAAIVAEFDGEASNLSINRDEGIARLQGNSDVLAQQRGRSVADVVARKDRLERQRQAFATAGPVSQYAVLVADFDPGIARRSLADFQPAIPVTTAGFVAGAFGWLFGWLLTHVIALPVRRRRPVATRPYATNWR